MIGDADEVGAIALGGFVVVRFGAGVVLPVAIDFFVGWKPLQRWYLA